MEDNRDLRDPRLLGKEILMHRAEYPWAKFSALVHELERDGDLIMVGNYPQDESLGKRAAREYQKEHQERAEAGDKYAISLLKGEPNDEPLSGNQSGYD